MAKTQDLKRRIRSIRNTMQVTRAMKMVSAAKLRRAQDRILRARPYAERTRHLLGSLAARATPDTHPLLRRNPPQRTLVVVVAADKGLCGSFNAGILRAAQNFARDRAGDDLVWAAIGKRSRDYLARRHDLAAQWTDIFRNVDFAIGKEIAGELMRRFLDHEVDSIVLVYNEFKSAIQARPVVLQLLPIEPAQLSPEESGDEYLYEPSAEGLFAALLPHYVEIQVFNALIESAAAEHAARMAAMDSATKNAGELIDGLTLRMNRVRQASITTEIIEVVSGAEALG